MLYLDTARNVMPVPATRSMAAIRRAHSGSRATPTNRETYAIRAVQYAEWQDGNETPHSSCIRRADKRVHWNQAADGSKRIDKVDGVKIPHWDWIPTCEDMSLGLFE